MNTAVITAPSGRERGLFGVDEFCTWAGISQATFYRETAAGRLSTRKIGRKTVVTCAEAERWVEALPFADTKLEAML